MILRIHPLLSADEVENLTIRRGTLTEAERDSNEAPYGCN